MIVEEFPEEVRVDIGKMVSLGYSSIEIYDWLVKTHFPMWREEHPEWCVTDRTIRNYIEERIPERVVVSRGVIEKAMERVEDDVDALANIKQAIAGIKSLIDKYDRVHILERTEVAELRKLWKEYVEMSDMYIHLQMKLGIVKEMPEKKEITVSEKMSELKAKMEAEKKKKEDEALVKAVSGLDGEA